MDDLSNSNMWARFHINGGDLNIRIDQVLCAVSGTSTNGCNLYVKFKEKPFWIDENPEGVLRILDIGYINAE